MTTNFNTTLQQVLGYTSLLGLLNKTGSNTPDTTQEKYKSFSDSVRANIRKHGIQKTSMAHIVFDAPFCLKSAAKISGALKVTGLATYRADSFVQPGVSFATTEIRRYGVGPIERKPYLPIFTDQTFSFINDSDGLIHKFFYLWMNGIIGFDELPRGNSADDVFGKLPFEVEYKQNYAVTIDIYVYNEVQASVGVLKLFNAYPTFIGDIQRNWADTDQLVRFPVTFTFSHWAYEELPSNLTPQEVARKPMSQNMALISGVAQAAQMLQVVSSIKRPQNVNDVLNVINTGNTLLRSLFPPSLEPKYQDYYQLTSNGE